MTPEDKKLIDKMFETSPQDEELKQRMLDDILSFGCAASKTTIEDGVPVMRYIDPISPEAQAAIYNAEHTDSFATHEKLTSEQIKEKYGVDIKQEGRE